MRSAPDAAIKVLIVDDHPAVRRGLAGLLGDEPDIRVVAVASDAAGAVDAARAEVDVVVCDHHLGTRTGLWVARRTSAYTPRPRVLIYSAFGDHALAAAARVAGADGLLPKSATGAELCLAVRRVAAGATYLPDIPESVVRALCARLDTRGRMVCALLVRGLAPDRIATQLGCSLTELERDRTAILTALTAARPSRVPRRTPLRSPLHYGHAR